MFTTACGFDEIVTGIDIPRLPVGTGWGFREFARRSGDFAVAGVGALLTLKDEAVATMTVVVFGVGGLPLRTTGAEKALLGKAPTAAVLKDARDIFEAELAPDETAFGSAAYKRQVAGVLFEQVVADAVTRAGGIMAGIGRA